MSVLPHCTAQRGHVLTTDCHLLYRAIRSDLLQNGSWYQDKLKEWLTVEGFSDEQWVLCFRGCVLGWNANISKVMRKQKGHCYNNQKKRLLVRRVYDKPWEGKLVYEDWEKILFCLV